MEPGVWRSPAVQPLFKQDFLADRVYSAPLDDRPDDPLDFSSLAKVEYLWPKLRNNPTPIAKEFPRAACQEIGLPVGAELPLVGAGADDTSISGSSYDDWIAQQIEFGFDQEFYEGLNLYTWDLTRGNGNL
ncbi:MAG: hypothetical protein R3E66_03425 [bacterium]